MKRPTAFTLVELLVVIGIIAILISILIPALSKARKSSFDIACRSNLREIGNATRMYANDNFDHYPDGHTLGGAPMRVGVGFKAPGDPWAQPEVFGMPALYRDLGYLKSAGVWICPAARPDMQDWGNTYIVQIFSNVIGKWTSQKRGREENNGIYWVYDNYINWPWASGSRRTSGTLGVFPVAEQLPPHNYNMKHKIGKRQGSVNMLFIDGHVGVVIHYLLENGQSTSLKVRDP